MTIEWNGANAFESSTTVSRGKLKLSAEGTVCGDSGINAFLD